MNLRPFPFATIGFRPYAETGEFVSVGVLAYDPVDRRMAFRFEDARRTGRVSGLFPGLDLGIFRAALRTARDELEAVADNLDGTQPTPVFQPFQDDKANLFDALTAPREGMIFNPIKGRRLATDLPQALNTIFLRYVHREDLEPQVRAEEKMEADLKEFFRRLDLHKAYRRDVVVGNEHYHTRFTFGHFADAAPQPNRVVRPINFDRKDTTEIYRHGDEWIGRMKRLEQFDLVPRICILSLRQPGTEKPDLMKAFHQVRDELITHQARCVAEGDDVALGGLVQLDASSDLALSS